MPRLRFSSVRWSLVSALIRWGSDSAHSHVEFEYPDGSTLGARFSLRGKIARRLNWPKRWLFLDGVRYRPVSANRRQCSVVHATFPKIDEACEWLIAHRLNVPYDLLGIVGIVTARGWADSHDLFCSEAIQESAIAVGQPLQNCSPEATKPRDLFISLNLTLLSEETPQCTT